MAKVLKQGTATDFKLESLNDGDMPASYAPGNWNTAFSWGDHAAAGYALTANLGTLATKDPGGTTNQLQVNDGSGGLAGAANVFADSGGLRVGSPAGSTPAGFVNAEGVQIDGVDLMPEGFLGWGLDNANLDLPPDNDLNAVRQAGLYRFASNTTGKPPGGAAGVVLHAVRLGGHGTTRHVQQVVGFDSGNQTFVRRMIDTDGNWGDWREVWTSGNLPVTVSGDGIGLGVSPTERLDVNGNARVRGQIIADNATGHTIGGNDFQYDTETVELGADFGAGAGSEVKCVRVGDQVTITGVGTLTHSSSASPSSNTVIPAKYRPPSNATNIYRTADSFVCMVTVNAVGLLQLNYRDWSGSPSSRINSLSAPSITYNV